jgi:hypothetical protein
MSPEQARAALAVIRADAAGDCRHPYTDQGHPQHSAFVQAATALHVAARPPADLGSPLSDRDQADVAAEIKALESTPGYISGKLRQQSLKAYDRLVAKIQALYQKAAAGRLAAEREAAQAVEEDPIAAAEAAEAAELAQAVERVELAEQDAAEDAGDDDETEVDDDDDDLQ